MTLLIEEQTKYLEPYRGKGRRNPRAVIKPYVSKWILYHYGYKEAFFFFSNLKIQKWPNFCQLEMDEIGTRVSFFLKKSRHENGSATNIQ